MRILLQWYCQIPGSRLWEADRRAGKVNEAMYNNYGFFRDLYLFRAGVRLSPDEIWEISGTVSALQTVARMNYPNRPMVEYGHPEPIALYYPEEVRTDHPDGLASLREVAMPEKYGDAARLAAEDRQAHVRAERDVVSDLGSRRRLQPAFRRAFRVRAIGPLQVAPVDAAHVGR